MRVRGGGWRWLAGLAAPVLCAGALLGTGGARFGIAVADAGARSPAPHSAQAHVATQGSPAAVPPRPQSVTIPDPLAPDTTTTTASAPPVPVQVEVSQSTAGSPLPAGFLGFSVEYGAIHAYLGRNPAALNPIFEQLLTGVDQGHSPILRIGGDSTDNSWLPLPGVIPPLGVGYTLTDDWLATVGALAEGTNARLILGVNLAADDTQATSAEARALVQGIGRSYIAALEVGNEPDLYRTNAWYYLPNPAGGETEFTRRSGDYAVGDYVNDFARWQSVLPDLPLAAGALAGLNWLPNVDGVAEADPDVAMVTVHRYPLSACVINPSNSTFPSLANLLSPAATEGLAAPLAPYAQAINAEHRTLRVDELNSASCEGAAGVSDTFGSALWILNELFDMAAAGVDGVNVHTLPGSHYAPFSFSESHGIWSGQVEPLYYGMLMFASAFPTGASPLDVSDSSSANGGDVKAYATVGRDGQVHTTILNEDASSAADVQLTLPSGGDLTEETLTAPSLSATTGVSLGGQSFSDPTTTGTLAAPTTSTIASSDGSDGSDGSFAITVPAASAVLLTGG